MPRFKSPGPRSLLNTSLYHSPHQMHYDSDLCPCLLFFLGSENLEMRNKCECHPSPGGSQRARLRKMPIQPWLSQSVNRGRSLHQRVSTSPRGRCFSGLTPRLLFSPLDKNSGISPSTFFICSAAHYFFTRWTLGVSFVLSNVDPTVVRGAPTERNVTSHSCDVLEDAAMY